MKLKIRLKVFGYMTKRNSKKGTLQKTTRCTMAIIRHMRRSAFSAGRPGGLIREIACKGNMRAALSDEKRKTLGMFTHFFKMLSAFRSRKVVISFPPPEKRKISADIRSECLYGFEVMDFGYCSCG